VGHGDKKLSEKDITVRSSTISSKVGSRKRDFKRKETRKWEEGDRQRETITQEKSFFMKGHEKLIKKELKRILSRPEKKNKVPYKLRKRSQRMRKKKKDFEA